MGQKKLYTKEREIIKLGHWKSFDLFFLNLKTYPKPLYECPVLQQCCDIEHLSWNPKKDFFESLLDSTSLIFAATKDGTISSFILFSFHKEAQTGFCSIDEMMIHPDYRRAGLSRVIAWKAVSKSIDELDKSGGISDFVLAALTVNPLVMNILFRYRMAFQASSFRPNQEVRKFALEYIRKLDMEPFCETSPWFVKQAFPRSLKEKPPEPNPKMKHLIPKDFDAYHQGDGMLIVGQQRMLLARVIVKGWTRYLGIKKRT